MKDKPYITQIEIFQFEYKLNDIGVEPTIGIPIYKPGNTHKALANGVLVETNEGITGEYIGGSSTEYSAFPQFAPSLIGRNALHREDVYNDAKQATRQHARMGTGAIDMALWDLAGKFHDAPIYELLGGTKRPLPCLSLIHI